MVTGLLFFPRDVPGFLFFFLLFRTILVKKGCNGVAFYSINAGNHEGKDELGLYSTVDLVYSRDPGKKTLLLFIILVV